MSDQEEETQLSGEALLGDADPHNADDDDDDNNVDDDVDDDDEDDEDYDEEAGREEGGRTAAGQKERKSKKSSGGEKFLDNDAEESDAPEDGLEGEEEGDDEDADDVRRSRGADEGDGRSKKERSSSSSKSSSKKKKKRKKKQESRRNREASSDEDEASGEDEEMADFIVDEVDEEQAGEGGPEGAEGGGSSGSSDSSDSDEVLDEDEEEEEGEPLEGFEEQSQQASFRRLAKGAAPTALFGDDTAAPGEESDGQVPQVEESDEDADGWIEDDRSRLYGADMSSGHLSLISEIFGDVDAVLDILGRRKSTRAVGADKEAAKWRTEREAQSSTAEDKAPEPVVSQDEILRNADQPERLFLRYSDRPAQTAAADIRDEAEWITRKLYSHYSERHYFDEKRIKETYREMFEILPEEEESSSSSSSGPASNPQAAGAAVNSEGGEPSGETASSPASADEVERRALKKLWQENLYPKPEKGVRGDVEEKCAAFLEMLLNERLEVAFILHHRRHLLTPPLTNDMLWNIYEWDLEWWRLRSQWTKLTALLHSVVEETRKNPDDPQVNKDIIQSSEILIDEAQLDDLKIYLYCQFYNVIEKLHSSSSSPTATANGGAGTTENNQSASSGMMSGMDNHIDQQRPETSASPSDMSADVPAISVNGEGNAGGESTGMRDEAGPPRPPGGIKRRTRAAPGLDTVKMVRRYDVNSAWQSYLLNADQLALNLRHLGSSAFDAKAPEEELLARLEAPEASPPLQSRSITSVIAWLETLACGPFATGERVLDALVAHEAKMLSCHPQIRARLRREYIKHCSVSTVATPKGEQEIDVSSSYWQAVRMFRRPLSEFKDFRQSELISVGIEQRATQAAEMALGLWPRWHFGALADPRDPQATEAEKRRSSAAASQGGWGPAATGAAMGGWADESAIDEVGTGSWSAATWTRSSTSSSSSSSMRTAKLEELERVRELGMYNELFIEAVKAESNGLCTLVIHPITSGDTAPWRALGSNAEVGTLAGGASGTDAGDLESIVMKYPRAVREPKLRELRRHAEVETGQDESLATSTSVVTGKCDVAAFSGMLEGMKRAYGAVVDDGWTIVQEMVIARLLARELLPTFRREVRTHLLKLSEAYIAHHCRLQLIYRLSTQPYRLPNGKKFREHRWDAGEDEDEAFDSDDERGRGTGAARRRLTASSHRYGRSDDEEDDDENSSASFACPKVIALVVEKVSNGLRVHGVALDNYGELKQVQRFESLMDKVDGPRKQRDLRHLQRFLGGIDDFLADAVVIGAGDMLCNDLYAMVRSIRETLLSKRPASYVFELFWGLLEVPRIFASSSKCPVKFRKSLPLEAIQAISLGRMVQDPLAETAGLWSPEDGDNHLLHLRLHHFQGEIPRAKLEAAVLSVLLEGVAEVGVDFNRVRPHPHLACLLPFLPGLGPVKAQHLINRVSAGNPVLFRKRLLLVDKEERKSRKSAIGLAGSSEACLPEMTFRNASSFIRIAVGDGIDEEDIVDRLDDSRIHPAEGAVHAIRLCKNALSKSDAAGDGGGASAEDGHEPDCVGQVLKQLKMLTPAKVGLGALALELAKKGMPRMLPYLKVIMQELRHPYKDYRDPFEDPPAKILFYSLIEEDPRNFAAGSDIMIRIVESKPTSLRAIAIPWNLRCTLKDSAEFVEQEITRKRLSHADSGISEVLPVGMTLTAKIAAISYDGFCIDAVLCDRAAGRINASVAQRLNISRPANVSLMAAHDVAKHRPRESVDTRGGDSSSGRHSRSVKRRIVHSAFRPSCSHSAAVAEVTGPGAAVGFSIFRGNEKSSTELLLYVKTCDQPPSYKVFTVHESNQPSPGELGELLKIANTCFADLNQIMEQFVAPLKMNLEEIYASPKYSTKTPDELKVQLAAELSSAQIGAGSSGASFIKWGLSLDRSYPPSHPGVRFQLLVVHSKSGSGVAEDGLYVSPEGFKLWLRKESTFRKLCGWWKTEGFFARKTLKESYNQMKRSTQQLGMVPSSDAGDRAGRRPNGSSSSSRMGGRASDFGGYSDNKHRSSTASSGWWTAAGGGGMRTGGAGAIDFVPSSSSSSYRQLRH